MTIKERNLIWDNYKGILIILVVFAHFLYAYSVEYPGSHIDDIVTFIYLFHMPAFIFCSGYFSTSVRSRNKKSILKLVIYYLIFNTSMLVFMYFYDGKHFSFLYPYNSYWYLFSLVIWRLSIKYLERINWIIPFSFIIALLIGYHSEFSNFLSIKRTIAFFPFFLIGYKFGNDEILLKLKNLINEKNKLKQILSFIVLTIISICVYLVISKYKISNSMLLMSSYDHYKDIIYRVFIFVVAFTLMILLLLICPNKNIKVITKAGKNSLGIYLFHRFLTFMFLDFFGADKYSNKIIIYSIICTFIITIVFESDVINMILNKKVSNMAVDIRRNNRNGKKVLVAVTLLFIIGLSIKPLKVLINTIKEENKTIENKEIICDESDFKCVVQKYKDKKIYKLIDQSKKITFIGDSITKGTYANHHHPYYEPLMENFDNKTIINISELGYTTKKIYNEYKEEITNSNSDLYIIALGINDIRFRNPKSCAMNSEEYILQLDKIVQLVNKIDNDCNFVFIAPWLSLSNDIKSKLSENAKINMINEYSKKLNEYCKKQGYLYINPNNYIEEKLNDDDGDATKYIIDYIHPNDTDGIKLYSEAILHESE